MKAFILIFTLILSSCATAQKPTAPQDQNMIEVSTIIEMLKEKNSVMYEHTSYKIGYMNLGQNHHGQLIVWSCDIPGFLIFDQNNFAQVPNFNKVRMISNALLYCKEMSTKVNQPDKRI